MLKLINDGQTFPCIIKENPGYHGAVNFTYRPAGNNERTQYDHELRQLDHIGRTARRNKFVADHVTEWDVQDDDGKAVPVTAESVNQLRRALGAEIYLAILEGRASGESIGNSVKN